jgi:hypothetical protein
MCLSISNRLPPGDVPGKASINHNRRESLAAWSLLSEWALFRDMPLQGVSQNEIGATGIHFDVRACSLFWELFENPRVSLFAKAW